MLGVNLNLGQRGTAVALLCVAFFSLGGATAQAEPKPVGGIYTCTDANGKRHTADRPIRECLAREQQLLNSDGSVRVVVPPSRTAEERAEIEARERKLAAQRMAIADAGRRDRNLLNRYPDEASHQRARESALETVRQAVKASESRLRELSDERRPLLSEAEFYDGRQLPPKLRQALDANDAAAAAQRNAGENQAAEIERVARLYDAELARLRQLWSGTAPGSLGPLVLPKSGSASK